MRRKLVKQGAATLMVSLPAKWVKEHHLAKGSEVVIEQQYNNLVIATDHVEPKTEISITLVNQTESAIRTVITNTYRRGFDKIIVHYSKEEQYRILADTVKTRLIGFDITKKEKDSCVVENITEPSPDHFDNLSRKILFSISELFELTTQYLQGTIPSADFFEVEERIQKYDNFCRRILTNTKPKNYEYMWAFLTLIVHAQRELFHLIQEADSVKKKQSASKQVQALLEDTKDFYDLIKKSFLEKNSTVLATAHTIEKDLIYTRGYKLLSDHKGIDVVAVHHLLSCIREFYLSTSPLLGLLMD
jgi:phosphate uptake regulator